MTTPMHSRPLGVSPRQRPPGERITSESSSISSCSSSFPASASSSASAALLPTSSFARLASLLASSPLPSQPSEKKLTPEQQGALQRRLEETLQRHLARACAENREVFSAASPEAHEALADRQQVYGRLMSELSTSPSPRAASAVPFLAPRLQRLLLSSFSREEVTGSSPPLQHPEAILHLLLHLGQLHRGGGRRGEEDVSASGDPLASARSTAHARPPRDAERNAFPAARPATTPTLSTPRSIRCESVSSVHTDSSQAFPLGRHRPSTPGGCIRRRPQRVADAEREGGRRKEPVVEEEEEDANGATPVHELGLVYDLSGVSEVALLRDIVYTLQGVDGVHVAFDEKLQTYLLSPKVRASNSLRALVSHLSGVGALYRRLVRALEDSNNRRESEVERGGDGRSVVAEALHQCLQEQIQEYHKLVAAVECDVIRSAEDGAWSSVTLRRFAVWLQEPYCRMRALAALAEEARGLKGGPLLSTIYAHSRRGDPELRMLMLHILTRAAEPLADMTYAWIDQGELRDPADEFFVTQRLPSATEELWSGRYFVKGDRIPVFFPPSLATEILRVGKSLNFLRMCGDSAAAQEVEAGLRLPSFAAARASTVPGLLSRETARLPPTLQLELAQNPFPHVEAALLASSAEKKHSGAAAKTFSAALPQIDDELAWLDELRDRVHASSAARNRRVVTTLLERHQLLYYLEGIRKFILLEDGEFTRSLLEAAEAHEELQRRRALSAVTEEEENLQNLCAASIAAQPAILAAVDAAARGSGAGGALFSLCPPLLHALTVRFPPTSALPANAPSSSSASSPSCSGVSLQMWDAFYLDLKLSAPLASFCTPAVMGVFHKVFYLQWKLHRASHALAGAWLQGRSLFRLQQTQQQQRAQRAQRERLAQQTESLRARQPQTPRAEGASAAAARGQRTPTPRRSSSTRARRRVQDRGDEAWSQMEAVETRPDGERAESFLWEKLRQREEREHQNITQQRCLAALNKLAQALTHLRVYLVSDVLNPAWRSMMRLLTTCNDFDEVLAVRQHCVETLYDGMFLYDAATLQEQLQSQQGAGSASELSSRACSNPIITALIHELLAFATQLAATARALFSALEAAADDPDEAQAQREREAAAAGARKALDGIQARLRGIFFELLRQLAVKQANARACRAGGVVKGVAFGDRGEALRALQCRLDFNAFYGHQAQVAAGSPPSVLLPTLSPVSAVSPLSPYGPVGGGAQASYATLLRRALPQGALAAPFLPGVPAQGEREKHHLLLQLLLLHQRKQQEREEAEQGPCFFEGPARAPGGRGAEGRGDGARGRAPPPSETAEVSETEIETEAQRRRAKDLQLRQREASHEALLRGLPWLNSEGKKSADENGLSPSPAFASSQKIAAGFGADSDGLGALRGGLSAETSAAVSGDGFRVRDEATAHGRSWAARRDRGGLARGG